MGGASSLLQQNNWDKADGRLRGPVDTIDGAPPTADYGVYYLIKRGLNQREFDVTDEESNLLFTTRPVPGTIACFDVVPGNSIDCDPILRINVNLSRRYWIVYRYDEPAFEGQKPDKKATQGLATEPDFCENDGTPVPFLFKKACVTVSWSRYMAVAALYGPPVEIQQSLSTRGDYGEDDKGVGLSTDAEEMLFEEASKIASRMKDRALADDREEESSSTADDDASEALDETPALRMKDRALADDLEEESNLTADDDASKALDDETLAIEQPRANSHSMPEQVNGTEDDSDVKIPPSSSMPDLSLTRTSSDQSLTITSVPSHASARTIAKRNSRHASVRALSASTTANVRQWIRQQSESIRASSFLSAGSIHNGSKEPPADPFEGAVDLDRPLLLCQEIYNRIIGNHQTSLVSKQEVLALLKEDMAQHVKEHPEDSLEEGQNVEDDPIFDMEREALLAVDVLDDGGLSHGNGVEETKEVALVDDEETNNNSVPNSDADCAEGEAEPPEEEQQPLVGYWAWEHTLRTHRMKLHLAKGGDLALHVVLAIISNQVRYERNAIAMTV